MSPLVALACVLCAFALATPSLATPARPVISKVFEAQIDTLINVTDANRHAVSLKGTAVWAADTMKAVETYLYSVPVKETTLLLWREDLGKFCSGWSVSVQSTCTCEDGHDVPDFWSPLTVATFDKTASCTGVSPARDCDFWNFSFKNGTATYEVFSDSVNTPSCIRATDLSDQDVTSFVYVITKWKTSAIDQTLFALPTTCANGFSAARAPKTALAVDSARRLIGLKK